MLKLELNKNETKAVKIILKNLKSYYKNRVDLHNTILIYDRYLYATDNIRCVRFKIMQEVDNGEYAFDAGYITKNASKNMPDVRNACFGDNNSYTVYDHRQLTLSDVPLLLGKHHNSHVNIKFLTDIGNWNTCCTLAVISEKKPIWIKSETVTWCIMPLRLDAFIENSSNSSELPDSF